MAAGVSSDASEFMQIAARFARRATLYAQIDRDLYTKTRFFGAASMTNKVLARLFEFHPTLISIESGKCLQDLGAVLEHLNVSLANAIRLGAESGGALDRRLVQAEQRAAQLHWRGAVGATARLRAVEDELNDLLNDSHILCLFARFWKVSRDYAAILSALRRRMGGRLEFGNESHRVGIGCALIDHLHQRKLVLQRGAAASDCTLAPAASSLSSPRLY
jgi:hypothetical protein